MLEAERCYKKKQAKSHELLPRSTRENVKHCSKNVRASCIYISRITGVAIEKVEIESFNVPSMLDLRL